MVEVENLTFGYRGAPTIFEAFNWRVGVKESWAVIGASGCGKSTLLGLLAGLRRPLSGSIRIAGTPIRRPRPQTGLVLQDHGLLPWATVEENAGLGFRIRRFYGPDGRHAPQEEGCGPEEARCRVRFWLKRLAVDDLRKKYPTQLSRGQRQRAAIARTLALEPDLLLLDEPFSALDAPIREDLQHLTRSLHAERGLTTIIVTHDIEEAVFMGQQILVLRGQGNRASRAVPNTDAAGSADRHAPQFQACCRRLRSTLRYAP